MILSFTESVQEYFHKLGNASFVDFIPFIIGIVIGFALCFLIYLLVFVIFCNFFISFYKRICYYIIKEKDKHYEKRIFNCNRFRWNAHSRI